MAAIDDRQRENSRQSDGDSMTTFTAADVSRPRDAEPTALRNVADTDRLRAAAGLSFIGFGLWTLRGDQLAGNEERRVGPPLVTVAVSFFLAEMGDKTQLATAVLAAQATSLLPVWLGSVLGMILADGLAVAVGHLLGRRLPERPLKIGAAALFLLFGVLLLG